MSTQSTMKTDRASFRDVTLPRRAAVRDAGLPLPLGIALLGCTPNALDVLRKLVVAVIGCGSVGGRIALLLARMGLGHLLLVDPKIYKTSPSSSNGQAGKKCWSTCSTT